MRISLRPSWVQTWQSRIGKLFEIAVRVPPARRRRLSKCDLTRRLAGFEGLHFRPPASN